MKRGLSLINAQVAIILHTDALNVDALLSSVLEPARAAPVHGDLAVRLHLELD
jgi:hypothetical protein